jgi:Putative Na+/H+ antiporter
MTPFPLPLDQYPPAAGAGLLELLQARATLVPFNLAASGVFLLAILHTFATSRFLRLAHRIERRHAERTRAQGREPEPSVAVELLHFFGEVEVVFGLWVIVLVGAIVAFYDWDTAKHYLDSTVNYTEPLFVVVIMAIASTRPLIALSESLLRRAAALLGGTPRAWCLAILTLAPPLGSLITEPAAMTIAALLLLRKVFAHRPSATLSYATLGLLFVNVSVGGTLTHFAAPPVLMVARPWGWDVGFMLAHFGWKALVGILVSNLLYAAVFHRQLKALGAGATPAGPEDRARVPGWVTTVHLAFLAFCVANAHYPALFIGAFLFFLGFLKATAQHQAPLDLKPPLLVGFFLGGLVIHGGLQGWWIAPVLASLGEKSLFFGALLLTALNDNALITYLATLVPSLSEPLRYAVVAGAVAGGGLTVIANAPNPAGQSILAPHFEDGIRPLGLLLGALPPTAIVAGALLLL